MAVLKRRVPAQMLWLRKTFHIRTKPATGTRQHEPRVGDAGGTGIGDQSHHISGLYPGGDSVAGLMLVEFVMAVHRSGNLKMLQQFS